MTYFRKRGLQTQVDTIRQAEFDFASHQIDPKTQEEIARTLKELPRSMDDRVQGDLRFRQIAGWDVCYLLAADGESWVVTIAGVAVPGEFETAIDYLVRAGVEGLPAPVRSLLEGKRRK